MRKSLFNFNNKRRVFRVLLIWPSIALGVIVGFAP